MNNTEVLQMIANLTPAAQEAFSQWMALQWAKFGILAFLVISLSVFLIGIGWSFIRDPRS